MEYKKLTQAQVDVLQRPLPAEALKPHPSKSFLSSINAIYVTERLNEVFGVGAWQIHPVAEERKDKMVVVRTTLTIPEYGIEYECFGGNDNADLGDAYKGATTDAITKIGSWLGIGAEVWKNEAGKPQSKPRQSAQKEQAQPQVETPKSEKKMLSFVDVKDNEKAFIDWLYNAYQFNPSTFSAEKRIEEYYECDYATTRYLCDKFDEYIKNKK